MLLPGQQVRNEGLWPRFLLSIGYNEYNVVENKVSCNTQWLVEQLALLSFHAPTKRKMLINWQLALRRVKKLLKQILYCKTSGFLLSISGRINAYVTVKILFGDWQDMAKTVSEQHKIKSKGYI